MSPAIIYIYIYIYTYSHTHTYIHVYIHTYIHAQVTKLTGCLAMHVSRHNDQTTYTPGTNHEAHINIHIHNKHIQIARSQHIKTQTWHAQVSTSTGYVTTLVSGVSTGDVDGNIKVAKFAAIKGLCRMGDVLYIGDDRGQKIANVTWPHFSVCFSL
jgi:hypothetical protein